MPTMDGHPCGKKSEMRTDYYQLLVSFHDDPDLGIDALVYEL